MNRKPPFSFGISIIWICVSTLQIIDKGMRISFERSHGVTEWVGYAFLVFWIGLFAISAFGVFG